MGRSSEGSGHARTCTLDAMNETSPSRPAGRDRLAGIPPIGVTAGMREGTDAVARCQPLRVTNATFPHRFAMSGTPECAVHWEMCKNCTVFNTAASAAERLNEV